MSSIPAVAAYRDAHAALDRGDLENCDRLLRALLAQDPEDGRAWELQGLAWYARRAHTACRRALEAAGLLVPLSVPAQLALADVYQRCGRREEALSIVRFLAERDDLARHHLPQLSAALGRLGQYALALDVCRAASLRDADDDEACFGMAYFMQRLGYPTECVLPLLRRALALEPERPIYRLSVGVVCARTGLLDDAYELLCGVDPRCVTCASCLQTMARLFGQFDDGARYDAVLAQVLRLPRKSSAATPGGEWGGC